MSEEIINKVASSSLVQIDLEDFLPEKDILTIDLASNLFEGMILREKDFREFIKTTDWTIYKNQEVTIFCSADAIIPKWAYMLLTSVLVQNNAIVYSGQLNEVKEELLIKNFLNSDLKKFTGKKVLVKGCGSFELSPKAFVEVTKALQNNVQSLMFGEACSSVPISKKKNQ